MDFGQIRIHTNQEATQSARMINARAYTFGNNIVFNDAEYAPETHSGKWLLAHELTHTIQQGYETRLTPGSLSPDPGPEINRKSNPTNRPMIAAVYLGYSLNYLRYYSNGGYHFL